MWRRSMPTRFACVRSCWQRTGSQGSSRAAGTAAARRPPGYWAARANRRHFLEEVAAKYHITEAGGWRKVANKDVLALGGAGLLAHCSNSLHAALRDAFPEQDFAEAAACRSKLPRGHWDSRENREAFLAKVAKRHGITSPADWRHVTVTDMKEMAGGGLMNRYGNHMAALLLDLVPEVATHMEETEKGSMAFGAAAERTAGYWQEESHRRRFVEELAARQGVNKTADWAGVATSAVRAQRGGSSFLAHYGGSLLTALRDTMPEMSFTAEAFEGRVPLGYWEMAENRRQFMEEAAEKLRVQSLEDWKRVSSQDIVSLGGAGLLARYGNSLFATLRDTLPGLFGDRPAHEPLDALACRKVVPTGYWDERENVRAFMEHARQKLEIGEKAEWQRVSQAQLHSLGSRSLLAKMSLKEALETAYPDERWEEIGADGSGQTRASQRHMHLLLRRLLVTHAIEPSSRTAPA